MEEIKRPFDGDVAAERKFLASLRVALKPSDGNAWRGAGREPGTPGYAKVLEMRKAKSA
jgi:hypothetical protein